MANVNVWGGKNAWGKADDAVDPPVLSFVEIMSEEMVQTMVEEDEILDQLGSSAPGCSDASYVDDEEMARALQRQFDREAEIADLLERNKDNHNKTHNTVCLENDRYCPTGRQWNDVEEGAQLEEDSDEEELREISINKMYEREGKLGMQPIVRENGGTDVLALLGETRMKTMNEALGPFIGGLMKDANGEIISKHDPSIVSTRNVEKVMNDVIDVPTGDCYSVSVNSAGNVFSKLRSFSKTEQKRVNRLKDKEEKATIDTSVDAVTRLTLFKWINQGLFDRVDGIIATGKESAVLSAGANSLLGADKSFHLAIKVYKTSLVDFKNRSEYVQNDFRFKNPRGVMRIWAEKEFMNLTRMFNKQLPCPEPIKLRKHIMVMSFIGDESGKASPKLKNVQFEDDDEKESAFLQTQDIVMRMYAECKLVHGDLSEFNLLWKDGRVYVIDVSQAMDLSHPRVLHYLLRDLDNVLSFFHRHDTRNLPTRTHFFNLVTGLSMNDNDDLNVQVEDFEAVNRNVQLRLDKSKPADMEFRKFMAEKKEANEDPSQEYY